MAVKRINSFSTKNCCLWCFRLDVESVDDLRKVLTRMGYPPKAIEEILKWYKQNDS